MKLKIPNDNISIAKTEEHLIKNNYWPFARINGTFRYQSEVTKAFLDWCDIAVF